MIRVQIRQIHAYQADRRLRRRPCPEKTGRQLGRQQLTATSRGGREARTSVS